MENKVLQFWSAGKATFTLESLMSDFMIRGVTKGPRKHNSPGAESLWGRRITAGGLQITAEGAEKFQQIARTFFTTVNFLP